MRFTLAALALAGVAAVSAIPTDAPAGLEARNADGASRDFGSMLEARNPKKHHKSRGDQVITGGKLTWYGGGQLNNPACGGHTPSRHDHVVAVKQGGHFKCGDTVHIHHKGKMVSTKVVDYCGGCASNHVDATQGVFSELANLEEGELHGVHFVIPN